MTSAFKNKTWGNTLLMVCFVVAAFFMHTGSATADLEKMTKDEMAAVHGQGTTNLYIEDNTVRLFLDVHMETYGTIDSIKAGYYDKTDFTTYKNNINDYNEGSGANINDNFSYVKDSSGNIVITGSQGSGVNTNTLDWDMNWENVQIGESYEAPLVIDGLIVRTEFDDISSSSKKLKRIIIGTNNMQGQISGEFIRTTGAVNPVVPVDTSGHLAALGSDALVMNRDSVLNGLNTAGQDTLNINGGFFIELNLDGNTAEQGIKTVIGYQESAAVSMTFGGSDWWDE